MRNYMILGLIPLLMLGACSRSNLVRIRATLSGMEQGKAEQQVAEDRATSGATLSADRAKTDGMGLHLVAKGIMLGGSTLTTTFAGTTSTGSTTLIQEKSTLKTSFTEAGFVIGEDFTWGFGVGMASGGTMETELTYGSSYGANAGTETLQADKVSGTSSFFMLGHHGSNFETVFGLRWNSIKVHYKDWDPSLTNTLVQAQTLEASPSTNLHTTQAVIGIGFVF
jgi:hypothetical protein